MNRLRIHVDLDMPSDVLSMLQSETAGHELVFPDVPVSSVLTKGVADPQFETVDIAFGQPDTQAIATARQLKWIQVSSSGITRYDTPEFRALMAERQIAVCNSASVYQKACAVHALSFLLAQARKLPPALASRAANGSREWNDLRAASRVLEGESILILGYGAIGKHLATLLRPLGMNVIACRRAPRGDEGVAVVRLDQLHEALGSVEHVMNILPESPETRHFFDRARFAACRKGAVFYNIGRGATVDQAALNDALCSGHLAAAWLDVTDPEPLPEDHPLRSSPNCFITPHTAGGHPNEARTLVRHFLDNLRRYVHNQPLHDRVM